MRLPVPLLFRTQSLNAPAVDQSVGVVSVEERVRARAALLVTGATSDDKQKLENEPARERRRR